MTSQQTSVLILPVGSGMAIAAIQAMRHDKSIRLVGADLNPLAAGMYLVDKAYIVPRMNARNFFRSLYDIIVSERIAVVIPALDQFLLPFSRRRLEIEQLGAKLIASPSETIMITRDKWKTYCLLKKHVPVPKSWINQNAIDSAYPLFIKPRSGSGSVDAFRVNNEDEMHYQIGHIKHPIIQEFLPGDEFTVDCLAAEDGRLMASVPRKRIETKAGVSTKSQTVAHDGLSNMATIISSVLRFSGPFFLQAKEDIRGVPRLTEINARMSGTMSLSSAAGWNIHLNAVRLALGNPTKGGPIVYGRYVSRYWKDVYIDESDIVT